MNATGLAHERKAVGVGEARVHVHEIAFIEGV